MVRGEWVKFKCLNNFAGAISCSVVKRRVSSSLSGVCHFMFF